MTVPTLRVAIDIGGTFTDLVAYDEATGRLWEAKASSTPADFAQGVLDAIAAGAVSPEAIGYLVHGTTVVINAITQRRGVRTALVTTAGFRDVLEIGRGNRPDMYNLNFHKPRPFVPRRLRFEIRERVMADGTVRVPIHLEDLDTVVEACRANDVEAIAVCFLHAYAHPQHERLAADYLRARLPQVTVSISSEITQEWREYERSSTVVLNAYVQPILDRYLSHLESRLSAQGMTGQRFVMLSNGGTATFDAARRQPIQLVESGPAGGIIGAALVGERIGEPNVIAFDVGGTTAKCSLIEGGELRIAHDYRLEWTPLSPGYPVRIPVVDIVEIGAGGGSIAWFDEGGALRVGPISAGADPGPACYGRGGTEPTVTDAMLIAGIIDPAFFLGGRLPIDIELARQAYAPVAKRLGVTIEEAAAGVIRIVNEHAIDALKLISVRRGYDPRDFTLVAFGGGGPMHAAPLASELGVKRVVIPPFPGTFSAWGMLMTEPRIDLTRTRVTRLDATTITEITEVFRELEAEAAAQLAAQGFERGDRIRHRRSADMRYYGQEHTVRVPIGNQEMALEALAASFHELHRRSYTFALADTPVEIVNFRTITTVELPRPALGRVMPSGNGAGHDAVIGTRNVDFGDGERISTVILARDALRPGFTVVGPAIVEEPSATTVVPPRQRLAVDHFGNLIVSPE